MSNNHKNTQPDLIIEQSRLQARRETVFLIFAGVFLGTLAMLNILGISRFLIIASWGEIDGVATFQWWKPNFDPLAWNFAIAVGVLPYPVTFLCTDLISEFYGRKRANSVVWVGLILNVWVMAILWLGAAWPGFEQLDPSTGEIVKDAAGNLPVYFQIKTLAFGAVTASMIAYLVAQFVDVYLYHFWKKLTKGKHLWLRNNGSTLISQLIDTIAVIMITHYWAHALPLPAETRSLATHLMIFITTGYAFKLVAALLDTPVIYLVVKLLSGYLQIDTYSLADNNSEENLVLFSDDNR